MDFDVSRIAHLDHPVAAPVATASVRALLSRLSPPPGGRVVDLGCGHGEWLGELLAARPDLTGIGVDVALPADVDARARARGVADRVTWVEADASGWDGGEFDVVVCVGASHAFGGLPGTLDAVRRMLRPGGQVLLGDAIWEVPPSTAAQEVLQAGATEFPDLPGLVDRARERGFEPGYGHVSTLAEWDDYEWSWTGSLTSWALQPARDPGEREQALAVAREHREGWLRGYRQQLGFVTLVLHDIQAPSGELTSCPAETVPADARVIAAVPGRTNVYVHLDVVYANRDGLDLHLQIIQPSGDAAVVGWEAAFANRYPCIAFVQGSGWREQALGSAMSPLCRFAERGFVIAVVEHRPSALAPHPAQVHDAKTAVRWLREHADEYGIDPERLTIAGDSSGGHTALLVHATDGSSALDEDPGAGPLNLSGAVAFYAPTDLSLMDHDDAVRDLLGGRRPSEDPGPAAAASPAHHLDRRQRGPVLLVHGTRDEVVPHEHSAAYATALREVGQECGLVLVEGGGHGVWPSLFNAELADVVEDFLTYQPPAPLPR